MKYIIFLTFLAHVQIDPAITEPTEEVKKTRNEIGKLHDDIKKKIRALKWDTVKPILVQHKESLLVMSNDYLHQNPDKFANLENFKEYIERMPQSVNTWLRNDARGLSESDNSVNQFIQASTSYLLTPWNAELFCRARADPAARGAMDRLVKEAVDKAHELAVSLLEALREVPEEEKTAVKDE